MMPDGIKERFELYRKWFKTLLVREFLNLPVKYQERFLEMANGFIQDCKKVMDENMYIQEKVIQILVERIAVSDTEIFVFGRSDQVQEKIKISLPINRPKPKIGSKLCHTVFSINGDVWYSSKEELVTKTRT